MAGGGNMNLLPKSSKEFGSVDYWEKFFQQRGKKAFEWYGTYLDLCGVLHKYIKPREKVLVIGCGNSELSEQLYDVGYQDIVNIDISEVVIKQMKERNASRRPRMSFLKMDMTQMEFPDASFQVVLDKGTLDAVLTDEEEKTLQLVDRMLAEVGRVLQVGGRYLCISLAQAHILKKAVGHFSREGWMVRVHQVAHSRDQVLEAEPQFSLPVFAFIMTKFRPVPGSALQIFELCAQEQGKPVRLESAEQLAEAVRERQQYAWLCSQLRKAGLGNVSLDLCSGDTGEPRYTLHVVDSPTVKPTRDNHFAIFIIPQGRETEWLFGMEEGRKQLAASAGFRRLITVALHRGQQYDGMDSIQAELSARVMELAPAGMPSQQKVPFLSVGGDIGVRAVQHQDCSPLSGEYVIEDVQGDDRRFFRRLIFLSSRNVVQSEARLLKDASHRVQKKRKKEKKKQRSTSASEDLPPAPGQPIDKSYLCCEHHKAMIAGLTLLRNPEQLLDTPLALLVVGLGGGSLPLFVHDHFPRSRVDAVEIDPSMLDVATQWFGFSQSDRMKVHIADGLDYITSLSGAGEARPPYDVIMFDVDSKDPTLGMSCPPPAFVEPSFLQKVRSILTPEGVFILNLVCRDSGLKDSVLADLKVAFPLLYVRRIEGEVNEILFCQLSPEQKLTTPQLLDMAQTLERTLKKPGRAWDDTYILSDMLKTVKIV
ncbi:eEF1A lysine and N-terminal methyltransferase isoform X1 [Perognathus longimembris pacificus]|uniref:eEF1A lysine and N-terminal methyltransferase isoform X1 n=1 Tax=Perognathus longimembris pacificus TaxID=214514 RepID=UPI0020197183|nr:eEF1A lysine and N-terminal methyltransferase isoform X1 [Perognathus longimembris pacificus]